MNGFHHRLNAVISQDLVRAMEISNPRSLAELATHRAIFPILRAGTVRMNDETKQAIAEADAVHDALKQPPDLKVVCDAAYAKMVTKPASVFLELIPEILDALPAVEELAIFLEQNGHVISYRDGRPTTEDPRVRAKLMVLMAAATASSRGSEKGKRKLRAMISGN